MRLLDRINRTGTTVVMATHDAAIVDQMRKRVVELEGGHLVRDQSRGVYGYSPLTSRPADRASDRATRPGKGHAREFVVTEVGIGLRRNLGLTVAVILAVLVARHLGGMAVLLHEQVNVMKDYWYDKVEVSVFLCGSRQRRSQLQRRQAVTDAERDQIRADLQSLPQVQQVYYESKARGVRALQGAVQGHRDRRRTSPPTRCRSRSGSS